MLAYIIMFIKMMSINNRTQHLKTAMFYIMSEGKDLEKYFDPKFYVKFIGRMLLPFQLSIRFTFFVEPNVCLYVFYNVIFILCRFSRLLCSYIRRKPLYCIVKLRCRQLKRTLKLINVKVDKCFANS